MAENFERLRETGQKLETYEQDRSVYLCGIIELVEDRKNAVENKG